MDPGGWEVGVPLMHPWTTLSPRGTGTGSCGSSGDNLTLLTLNKMTHGCRDDEQPDRLVTIISKCPGYPAQKAQCAHRRPLLQGAPPHPCPRHTETAPSTCTDLLAVVLRVGGGLSTLGVSFCFSTTLGSLERRHQADT